MTRQPDLFDMRSPYRNRPGHKERGGTSEAAARAVAGDADNLQREVYRAFVAAGRDGLTADEVAARVGRSVLSVRPRVTELAHAERPWIARTGERRRNESGHSAAVWRAT
jgi:DNA-directed RNA polymerase specialized sigma24 family protein